MVLLLRKVDTDQPVATKGMDNREDSSSSDEGNSAMVSDGDRSRLSSPPSAADMSYVVDEGNSSSHAHAAETSNESTYSVLLPNDQLLALAEMLPPPVIPARSRSATIDSSSVDNESLSRKGASLHDGKAIDNDESPLSYKSLEERTTSAGKTLRWERSKSHGSLSSAHHHSILDLDATRQQSLDSKVASTLTGSEDMSQKSSQLRSSPKIVGQRSKLGTALRRGKWTVEEEAYVARVIQDFNSGFLDAPAGTTLRTYLSDKLKCDPMRITKKFTGDACIGKRVFHPAVRTPSNNSIIDTAQAELDTLERRWRRRLEMQLRESAKKAAASAAVAAAATSPGRMDVIQPNPVAQTASWLDRAKLALQEQSSVNNEEALSLHYQIQEVQRLIHEGPEIQQTSADLPNMLDDETSPSVGLNTSQQSIEVEPADKRLRTDEDAQALVGFIRSVRESAASGDTF